VETKPPQVEEKPQVKAVEKPKVEEKSRSEKAPEVKPVKTAVKKDYLVAKVFVNLREKPSVNSRIITVIRKGAKVRVIGRKANHWKKVIYEKNGRLYQGWVDDRYFIRK